jgi:hypothetical protein
MRSFKRGVLLILLIFIQTNLFAVAGADQGILSGKFERLIIDDHRLSDKIGPGDRPIPLNEEYFKKIFPELKNPRLMKYSDLDISDQRDFEIEGYVFVLRGDFNQDGLADIAIVGKYDNSENSKENSFFSILTFKNKQIIREYFSLIRNNQAFLCKNLIRSSDQSIMTIIYRSGTDYCETIHWVRAEYKSIPCKSVW